MALVNALHLSTAAAPISGAHPFLLRTRDFPLLTMVSRQSRGT